MPVPKTASSSPLKRPPKFSSSSISVAVTTPQLIEGVLRSARSAVFSLCAQERFEKYKAEKRTALWVTPSSDGAESLVEDLRSLGYSSTLLFPAREDTVDSGKVVLVDPMQQQTLEVLQKASSSEQHLVVAPIRAVIQKTMSVKELEKARWELRVGETIDRELILEMLISEGYERASLVERRGEFSSRGDILDVYPIVGRPVRVELFDTEVESIRFFDLDTQRSVGTVESFSVSPMTQDEEGCILLDYFSKGSLMCLEEPAQLRLQLLELSHGGTQAIWGDFLAAATAFKQFHFTSWEDTESRARSEQMERLELPFQVQRVFPDRVEGAMGRPSHLVKRRSRCHHLHPPKASSDRAYRRCQSTYGFRSR